MANPLHTSEIELEQGVDSSYNISVGNNYNNDESVDSKHHILGQLKPNTYLKVHFAAPWLLKSEGRIVKYDPNGFRIWRALFCFSHTILSDWDTWTHLTYLTMLCGITFVITLFFDNSYKSISDADSVTARVNILISFVLAAYISIVINRWDRIRNGSFQNVWNGLENLNMLSCRILKDNQIKKDSSNWNSVIQMSRNEIKDTRVNQSNSSSSAELINNPVLITDKVARLSRACMRLLFLATQGDGNLSELLQEGLITEREHEWLLETQIGSRPLIIVSWLYDLFDTLGDSPNYPKFRSQAYQSAIIDNITMVRGGIGFTIGAINCQLPYSYVHLVHWTIQVLLTVLAIETGVTLAIGIYTKENGNGDYSPPAGQKWPEDPNVWYVNQFFQATARNMIFALFVQGIMKITDKLSNPMSKDDLGFPEKVYDIYMYNNCRAMRAGYLSANEVSYKL